MPTSCEDSHLFAINAPWQIPSTLSVFSTQFLPCPCLYFYLVDCLSVKDPCLCLIKYSVWLNSLSLAMAVNLPTGEQYESCGPKSSLSLLNPTVLVDHCMFKFNVKLFNKSEKEKELFCQHHEALYNFSLTGMLSTVLNFFPFTVLLQDRKKWPCNPHRNQISKDKGKWIGGLGGISSNKDVAWENMARLSDAVNSWFQRRDTWNWIVWRDGVRPVK